MAVQNRVFETLVDGEMVRVKRCRTCDEVKRVDLDLSVSAFWVKMRTDAGTPVFYPQCRACMGSEKKRLKAEDSVYAEKVRRWEENSYRRALQDPRRVAIRRKAGREWHRRRRAADPERVNEEARIQYRLSQERKGRVLVPRRKEGPDSGRRVPNARFRLWVLAYMAATGISSGEELARDLCVQPKRVREVLDGTTKNVTIDLVDCALLNARVEVDVDGVTVFGLDDLYPDAFSDAA